MKTALIYDELRPDGPGDWVEAEYESPETIRALLSAIEANGHEAVAVPFGPQMVPRLQRETPDLAFNIAEGREGPSRESIAPAVMDYLGIPYTGSDGVALGVSLNKAMTKQLAQKAGVPTPEFRLLSGMAEAEIAADELEYPVLVKPNLGGSSVGIELESIVHEPGGLLPVVEEHLQLYDQPCLAEAFVRGHDVTVGLLGNGQPELFPAGRIVAPGGLYSAQVKQQHERRVICPCELPEGLEERLRDWSLRVYRAIGARDFARADFMLDEDGRAHFLEINPLPGLSPFYGVFPVLAEAAGYEHAGLIGRIIELALERTKTGSLQNERLAATVAQQRQNC